MGEATCRAIRPLLSARLDGELPPREAAQVDAHLRGCGDCRREQQGLGAVRSLVRSMPVRRLPAHVPAAALSESRSRDRRLVTVATALAMVVGLLGGAAFALGSQPPTEGRTVQVPLELFVTDHLVHTTGGSDVLPALDDGGP